eukprot:gene2903-1885_t
MPTSNSNKLQRRSYALPIRNLKPTVLTAHVTTKQPQVVTLDIITTHRQNERGTMSPTKPYSTEKVLVTTYPQICNINTPTNLFDHPNLTSHQSHKYTNQTNTLSKQTNHQNQPSYKERLHNFNVIKFTKTTIKNHGPCGICPTKLINANPGIVITPINIKTNHQSYSTRVSKLHNSTLMHLSKLYKGRTRKQSAGILKLVNHQILHLYNAPHHKESLILKICKQFHNSTITSKTNTQSTTTNHPWKSKPHMKSFHSTSNNKIHYYNIKIYNSNKVLVSLNTTQAYPEPKYQNPHNRELHLNLNTLTQSMQSQIHRQPTPNEQVSQCTTHDS